MVSHFRLTLLERHFLWVRLFSALWLFTLHRNTYWKYSHQTTFKIHLWPHKQHCAPKRRFGTLGLVHCHYYILVACSPATFKLFLAYICMNHDIWELKRPYWYCSVPLSLHTRELRCSEMLTCPMADSMWVAIPRWESGSPAILGLLFFSASLMAVKTNGSFCCPDGWLVFHRCKTWDD